MPTCCILLSKRAFQLRVRITMLECRPVLDKSLALAPLEHMSPAKFWNWKRHWIPKLAVHAKAYEAATLMIPARHLDSQFVTNYDTVKELLVCFLNAHSAQVVRHFLSSKLWQSWTSFSADFTIGACAAGCGRREDDHGKFLICSHCRLVKYCGVECQKKHWRQSHKYVCTGLRIPSRSRRIEQAPHRFLTSSKPSG